MSLVDFLLHHTKTHELCAITENGWISAVVWIDHEDLFTRYLSVSLCSKQVQSEHWDALPVVYTQDGQSQEVPCHYIEVG